WSDGPAAHAKDVHVIVFHSLSSGKMVVNQRGADPGHLVCADGCADSAATDRYAAVPLPRCYGPDKRDDEVGIIIVLLECVGAEIDNLLPSRTKLPKNVLLQAETTVIGCQAKAHDLFPKFGR